MFDTEYIDIDLLLYDVLIIHYKENYPCIIGYCKNILDAVYFMNQYKNNENINDLYTYIWIRNDTYT